MYTYFYCCVPGDHPNMNLNNRIIAVIAFISIFTFLLLAFQAGQLLWGIIAALAIAAMLMVQIAYSRNRIAKEVVLEEFVARVVTGPNIFKVPGFFIGIPFFIVVGGISSKYESIFSIEYGGEEITIIYPGICSLLRNDMVKLTGTMIDGGKMGVHGKCMKACDVENMSPRT